MLHSFEKLEKVDPTTYKIPSVDVDAATVEEAWRIAEPQIPEGFKMWAWMELDNLPQID